MTFEEEKKLTEKLMEKMCFMSKTQGEAINIYQATGNPLDAFKHIAMSYDQKYLNALNTAGAL